MKPILFCVGTPNSFYDNISNVIGDVLKEEYTVVSCAYAFNMEKKMKELESLKKEGQEVIAIDLSFANREVDKPFAIYNVGLTPGKALGRTYKAIGDKSIHIFIEYFTGHKSFMDILTIASKKYVECDKFDIVVNDVVNFIKENFN